jgi:thiol:disulfide interchange protein
MSQRNWLRPLSAASALTAVAALLAASVFAPAPAAAASPPAGQAPAAQAAGGQAAPAKAAAIAWLDYEAGLARARREGKPVLVNFWADWCKYCTKMKAETYTDAAVIAELNASFVPVNVNTTKEQARAREYFVRGLPTIWFLDKDGQRITNLPGFVDAPMFLKILRFISSRSYETMEFDAFLKKGA